MKLISKSRFLDYLTCPKDAWFRLHKPDLEEFEVSSTLQHIFDQGYEAEKYAESLKVFTGMVEVKSRGEEAQKETEALIAKKVPAIFQPTFIVDGFMIRCDALVWNKESQKWDLYEIKSSTSRHDTGARDHLSDAAFQSIVLDRCGVPLGRVFIVHLNNTYIRNGELDIEALFVQEDSTDMVAARRVSVVGEMEEAKKYLLQETEPKGGCDCIYYGRSSHCESFALSHPHVPEYSVHDLYAIGKSSHKLRALIENKLFHLHDIEDSSEFNDRQQNQIETHKTKEEIVVKGEIERVLHGYSYPLYFFDYETFAPAVPIFDGYKPYQRMPIQFSLHYVETQGGPLLHMEYVHTENSDPAEAVAKKLIEMVDPRGTVLAWNVGFERSVTNELATRLPKYATPLLRICDQMQDHMEIFSKQHYVHRDFGGSSSIESVMNVLLPKMSYDHLPYTGQDVGFVWWRDIVLKEGAERDEKLRLITEYCKQDTFVMVEIWRILRDMVAK